MEKRVVFTKIAYLLGFLLLTSLLSGCAFDQDKVSRSATAACVPLTTCRCQAERQLLKTTIEQHGGKVIILGDHILLVLPSRALFGGYASSSISSSGYALLVNVANFISSYPKTLVKINAYTDSHTMSTAVGLALSQQQAENIGKALFWGHMNERLLVMTGAGATHAIQVICPLGGCEDNNRIEITLQKLPI